MRLFGDAAVPPALQAVSFIVEHFVLLIGVVGAVAAVTAVLIVLLKKKKNKEK